MSQKSIWSDNERASLVLVSWLSIALIAIITGYQANITRNISLIYVGIACMCIIIVVKEVLLYK